MSAKAVSDIDSFVASRIQMYRKRRNMTQIELAEHLGVSFQQVQKYEKGINRLGAGRLFQLAQVFNVPVTAFYPTQQSSNELKDDASQLVELSALIASADTLRLVQSFLAISTPAKRKRILALVADVAESERQGSGDQKTLPAGADGACGAVSKI